MMSLLHLTLLCVCSCCSNRTVAEESGGGGGGEGGRSTAGPVQVCTHFIHVLLQTHQQCDYGHDLTLVIYVIK